MKSRLQHLKIWMRTPTPKLDDLYNASLIVMSSVLMITGMAVVLYILGR